MCMTWSKAADSEKVLFRAISLLFYHNENLLHLMLNPDYPKLMAPPEVIKSRAQGFSSSEQLLVRIALDAWDGSGGIHFNELYEKLDPQNFQKMLLVLNYLYSPQQAIHF